MMQKNINLSIQFPGDKSSLLPIHSDVWSGDSATKLICGYQWLNVIEQNQCIYLNLSLKINFMV